MKHAIQHIHFVGIGGAGMSGIAEVFHNLGYTISGSDIAESTSTRHLQSLGIRIHIGHSIKNLIKADAVVTSTAIQIDNPEVLAAREMKIPVVPRAVMLAELMRFKKGIAIAGTHGKTTTTSLVTSVLAAADLDPTFVIGGKLMSTDRNAQLGEGEYLVAEADESDASFLNLMPIMSVVTNIDADHMETYGHDFSQLKKAFVDFLHRMPFYGTAILCMDDPEICSIMEQVNCPVITYGISENAQVRAINIRAIGAQMHFTVVRKNGSQLPNLDVILNLSGVHNVRNALAAIALATEIDITDTSIKKALLEFKGVGRRLQHYGEIPIQNGSFTLIDDYGHHPVELKTTIDAVRGAYPDRRLVLAFQPHRYTRTRDCFEDFVRVLGEADAVLLCDVYAAGEEPIVAADGRSLARSLRVAGKVEPIFVSAIDELPEQILQNARPGDIVLCSGAGSIGAVPAQVRAISQQRKERCHE